MNTDDPIASLARGFKLEDKRPERDYYVVTCRTCGERWSLRIGAGRVAPGQRADPAKSRSWTRNGERVSRAMRVLALLLAVGGAACGGAAFGTGAPLEAGSPPDLDAGVTPEDGGPSGVDSGGSPAVDAALDTLEPLEAAADVAAPPPHDASSPPREAGLDASSGTHDAASDAPACDLSACASCACDGSSTCPTSPAPCCTSTGACGCLVLVFFGVPPVCR